MPPLRTRRVSGGASTCLPLSSTDPSLLTPHPCTNDVFKSKTPAYYSTYIDTNYLFDYDFSTSGGVSSGNSGNYSADSTYIIPQTWFLTCDVNNICSKIPDTNGSTSVPTGEWITDYTNPNCLMGFYFPKDATNTFQYPTRDNCIHQIMGSMLVDLAANISTDFANPPLNQQIANRASVNVAEDGFPDFLYGQSDTSDPYENGTAVVPGWPMWFVQGWPSQ